MPTIKADGVATLIKNDMHGRRMVIGCRAWFSYPGGMYRWSRVAFPTEELAHNYGKRVIERYNRIFGQEATKDVQA